MNYIGPMNGQGLEIFQDGAPVEVRLYKGTFDATPGNGSLVLGRHHVDEDDNYVIMDLYELVFFNRKLTAPEVMTIYKNENCSDYQSPWMTEQNRSWQSLI